MNKTIFLKEFAAAMIDVLEDFLDEKNVQIPNDEKEGDMGEAIIYGSDFDFLLNEFVSTLSELAVECRKNPEASINAMDWQN